jgi:hypothetical protein
MSASRPPRVFTSRLLPARFPVVRSDKRSFFADLPRESPRDVLLAGCASGLAWRRTLRRLRCQGSGVGGLALDEGVSSIAFGTNPLVEPARACVKLATFSPQSEKEEILS